MPLDQSPDRVYYPQVDVLRLGAFLLVFVHHMPVIEGSAVSFYVKRSGAFGVDLFFVISAFLLFDLLYREHQRFGRINVPFFFVRRILRIWPLYFFALATLAACSWLVAGTAPDWPRLAGMALFLENFSSFALGNYAPLYAGGHLWTVSLEEQFYLFVPVITMLLIELRPRRAFGFLTFLFLFSLSARIALIGVGVQHPAVWVMPIARMEPFVLGFAVALVHARYGISKNAARCAFVLFVTMIVLGYIAAEPPYWFLDAHSRAAVAIVSIPVTALFVTVLVQKDALGLVFGNPGLVFLGKISYGLYVWHMLALRLYDRYVHFFDDGSLEKELGPCAWWSRLAAGLALTVLFALASYFAIERPFLRLKKKFTLVANR